MKYVLPALAAFLLPLSPAFSGNWFGPGPWANGAYYPGQYDGVYTATMFGGDPSVISGVLGFGLLNGAPTTSTNSTVSTNGTQNTITVDPFQNYFVTFVDGRTYAGLSIATVNNQSDQVSGGLFNGVAAPTVTTTTTNENTCSGGFTASLTGKEAVITFSGNNTGILQTSTNGIPVTPSSTFSLNGMKVGNQASQISGTTQ
jgi:hypothetical protein